MAHYGEKQGGGRNFKFHALPYYIFLGWTAKDSNHHP